MEDYENNVVVGAMTGKDCRAKVCGLLFDSIKLIFTMLFKFSSGCRADLAWSSQEIGCFRNLVCNQGVRLMIGNFLG